MIKRSTEDGFALAALIFFLTAASILIAAAVPDYLMEAQRLQEQELIFRGQEYTRAILKYQRKYKVYPPSIDALLSTNNIRFLRKAYTDPITGKPMRLITLNADGSVSGSVLYSTGASIANASAVGGSLGSTSIGNSSLNSTGLNGASGASGTSGTSGTSGSAGSPGLNGGLRTPGTTTGTGSTAGSASSGFSTGTFPAAGGTSASNNSPSGASTASASSFGTPSGGSTATAGIIGVASDSELESILVYNTRQKYKEWEFIALQSATTTTTTTPAASGTNTTGTGTTGPGTSNPFSGTSAPATTKPPGG